LRGGRFGDGLARSPHKLLVAEIGFFRGCATSARQHGSLSAPESTDSVADEACLVTVSGCSRQEKPAPALCRHLWAPRKPIRAGRNLLHHRGSFPHDRTNRFAPRSADFVITQASPWAHNLARAGRKLILSPRTFVVRRRELIRAETS
jgi:hypothetical protein